MVRIDYDQVAGVYDTDRAVPAETRLAWRDAIASYLPPASGLPVLDLGAGTGLFAAAIAEWFDATVVAVERSGGMREAARATARELRRVLRPQGWVLIRSAFPDRYQPVPRVEFWPAARALLDAFPSSQRTIAAFTSAGFGFQRLERVRDLLADSLREYLERARVRADSPLRQLPDDEFEEGLRKLERAAALETDPQPVFRPLDLLVLRAGPREPPDDRWSSAPPEGRARRPPR
jgi:SAM-dependent methyltransferase